MLIAHISDSHIELPAAEDSDRSGDLLRSVEHINTLDPQPDLVVHTGDVTHYGRPEEYAESVRMLDGLRAPFCVIPGNRDDRVELRKAFESRLPDNCHSEFVQYAIVNEGLCAIMLDSVSTQSNKARLCETRLSHFSALLAEAGDRPVVVFMHHPPFEVTESAYPVQFEDWSEVDALAEIVSRHRNVLNVYCGHSHRAAIGKIAGIGASTIPSMATDLRMGPPADLGEVLPVYRFAGE